MPLSDVEKDFDRLAILDSDGWTANNQYHDYLLRFVPVDCAMALEVGCGTGAFSRRLAQKARQVLALDLSSEMIRVAGSCSAQDPNIEYRCGDVMSHDLPAGSFDCVVTIATLHHLPLTEVILKLRQAVKPNGVLIILDLFEPERSLLKLSGLRDQAANVLAMGTSVSLRLAHNGRLRPPRAVRAAWDEHGKTDSYPTMNEVRRLCAEILPGARVRQHLLWRYSVVWRSTSGARG